MSGEFTIDDQDDILDDDREIELLESMVVRQNDPPQHKFSMKLPETIFISKDPTEVPSASEEKAKPSGMGSIFVDSLVDSPANLQYHPEVLDLTLSRKRRTAIFGFVGGVTGLILLGPIVGIAVGACAAIGTSAAGTGRERRKMNEIRRRRFGSMAQCRAERNETKETEQEPNEDDAFATSHHNPSSMDDIASSWTMTNAAKTTPVDTE